MKNIKEEDAIVFDRDTSAPKSKMKNIYGRRREFKNNQLNNQNQNNLIKQPNNIEFNKNAKNENDQEEEEEVEVEKEIEAEIEDDKDRKKEKLEEKKEDKKEIKKEEKKENEPKITIQIKKKEANNSNNNYINNKNNTKNKNLNNQNINKTNKILKNSSCQVDLMSNDETTKLIQMLKIKINKLVKDKQKLITQEETIKNNYEEQINQKKQEILTLSQINAKLKKNLENVSNQVNKLLDKVVEKKTIQKSGSSKDILHNNLNLQSKTNNRFITSALNRYKFDSNNEFLSEENKDKGTEIELLKEKLKMKESQLKNSLNLIEFLSKDNKRLKLLYDSLGKDNIENNNLNNYKLIEEIKRINHLIK